MPKDNEKTSINGPSSGRHHVPSGSNTQQSRKTNKIFITTDMEEAIFGKTVDKEATMLEVMAHIQLDEEAVRALKTLKD